MKELGKFIQRLRASKGMSPEELGMRAGIPVTTLQQIQSGRKTTNLRLEAIRGALCSTDAERSEFDSHLKASNSGRGKSILEMPFDEKAVALHVCPLCYEPFSGEEHRFVDRFVKKILDLAGIQSDEPKQSKHSANRLQFDVKRRIEWLEKGEAHLIVNLISLQRMRNVNFHPLPIQISLNGVMIRPGRAVREKRLASAKKLLALGGEPQKEKFQLLAIENEVGHVYLDQTLQIHKDAIKLLHTLDANKLADELKTVIRDEDRLLICDEVTALSTVRALGGRGMLVFQPASDQAVAQSDKRGILPAHALGLGVRRRENSGLIEYLADAVRMLLSFDTESVAAMYSKQYEDLVAFAKECLKQDDSLYLAGVRKISKSELEPLADKLLEKARDIEMSYLADQQARAFARRCLQLSRQALNDVPPETWPWHRVLRRARERIMIIDARDRSRIRATVITSIKTVLGIDPVRQIPITHDLFETAARDHRAELFYVLESELDVDLHSSPHLRPGENSLEGLEVFVSTIQKILEGTPSNTYFTAIKRVIPDSLHSFEELWNQYARSPTFPGEFRAFNWASSIPKDGKRLEIFRYLAINLGEHVGFIEAIEENEPHEFPNSRGAALQVTHIYIVDFMQKSGISRRLIWQLIELAYATNHATVWVRARGTSESVCQKFLRCGFAYDEYQEFLYYRLEGMKDDLQSPSNEAM